MTRADLYDWVLAHGCNVNPLAEHKAKVIRIYNPKNEREAFIALPLSEVPVYDFTVCKVCSKLGIPIPTHVAYVKPILDKLEKDE